MYRVVGSISSSIESLGLSCPVIDLFDIPRWVIIEWSNIIKEEKYVLVIEESKTWSSRAINVKVRVYLEIEEPHSPLRINGHEDRKSGKVWESLDHFGINYWFTFGAVKVWRVLADLHLRVCLILKISNFWLRYEIVYGRWYDLVTDDLMINHLVQVSCAWTLPRIYPKFRSQFSTDRTVWIDRYGCY